MMNSVQLIGRPGNEPEVKTFDNNRVVARFDMAVNVKRNKKAQWFRIVAWDKTAERVACCIKKGMQIAIDGTLLNDNWTDAAGVRRNMTEIRLNNFLLVDWNDNKNLA